MAERETDREDTSDSAERETGREHKSDSGEPAAPSIGAHTKIEHIPPEERLAGKEHDTEDAMGLEKRRSVTGEAYGPSTTRVIMRFVVFFAIVGVVFIGLLFLVGQLDQPPENTAVKAPWADENVEQEPSQPLQ
jgi:hypothetical protein